MTKFVFLILKVSLFAVYQSNNLQSSWFTVDSGDLRFFYHIRHSCRQQINKIKFVRTFLDVVDID